MSVTVLIVDDSLTVRMDLAEAFDAAGFRTVLCGSAAETRDAIAREDVGVVVLDVHLPDGDGVDLLREIHASPLSAEAPVLLLSSEAEVKDRIRGLQKGADDYVGKPYDTGYVVARAQELVRSRRVRRAGDRLVVLVIDDSSTYREALRVALDAAGYAVRTAASGEEGLRLAAVDRPAAVLVDSVMSGIDGATVIRKIRLDAALRGTPCVLLTASGETDAELRALEAGADAFLRKEEDLDVILARLGALLRRAQGDPAAGMSLLGPKRILAIDDSPTYLQAVGTMLRSEGYDVVMVQSGEEALEMLSVQSVDCILLDLVMPGLGGRQTCRLIKDSPATRDTPLILLTALENRDAIIDGLNAGADDFISKSSDVEVVRARVSAQLRRKQIEDERRKIREDLLRSELTASEERSARRIAEARAALVDELERKNNELETFSYSVSHDLRAPLRTIDGFGQMVLEDCGDRIDPESRRRIASMQAAAQRMGRLIDDLLALSRLGRTELRRTTVDVTAVARAVADELQRAAPGRSVVFAIGEGLTADADGGLLRVLLDNLMGNAWKFTALTPHARIEVNTQKNGDVPTFFVRDNGAGFDMLYAQKLFRPFQRLHTEAEFAGTGIGLATVHRVVDRHGGRVWAEGAVGEGAVFFFTLGKPRLGRGL